MSMYVCVHAYVYVLSQFLLITQLTDLHEIGMNTDDSAHSKALRCRYLRRVITQEKRELMRSERHYGHLLWDPGMFL
jgi:hypothetical protein